MKKLRLICFIILVMCIIPILCVSADTTGKSGNFSYSVKGNGTAVITGYDWAHSSGDVFVPQMIDGYTVTSIGDDSFSVEIDAYDIYKRMSYGIELEPGVTVHLPDGITSIGEKAFWGAPISSINIPVSVVKIGTGAFASCMSLQQFSVPAEHTIYATIDGVLYNKQEKELVCWPGSRLLKQSYVIPDGIKKIGSYAFYNPIRFHGKYPFSSIDIHSSIEIIGDYAFAGNYLSINQSSKGIVAPLKYVGKYAFYQATFYPDRKIIFEQIQEFGESAFEESGPYNLTSMTINTTAEIIPKAAFRNVNGACDLTLINSAEKWEIADEAFEGCSFGQAIDLTHCTNIGKKAFMNSSIDYRSKTVWNISCDIGESAFENARVNKIILSSGCTTIGNRAFTNIRLCSGAEELALSSIDIPNTVLTIGSEAFACSEINEVVLPDSVSDIAEDAFIKSSVTILANSGSYAEFWAKENGYSLKGTSGDDLSWLID